MLQYFGTEDIYNDLKGDRIHHPSNLLSLSLTDHHRFVYQNLWFEPLVRSLSSLTLSSVATSLPETDSRRISLQAMRCQCVGASNWP